MHGNHTHTLQHPWVAHLRVSHVLQAVGKAQTHALDQRVQVLRGAPLVGVLLV